MKTHLLIATLGLGFMPLAAAGARGGDFEDVVGANPEVLPLPGATFQFSGCVSAAFDASDRLWVLRSRTTKGLTRSIDTNDDFDDF